MVFLTKLLRYCEIPGYSYKRSFLDTLNLHVVGGSGGAGLPKYGGIGGNGGCVMGVAKENINLSHIKSQYKEQCVMAGNGRDSYKNQIVGTPGTDVILDIPVGLTVIHEQKILGEINEPGQKIILARGGRGGGPSNAWIGREGQKWTLQLELRLIADVGLLGFPNAGKSTLLRAVSKAKPKVASYPFTTIRPNIGVMEFPDLRTISVADLPGLIEGAHKNIGMGHRFLRHVERTKLLLMLVDIDGFTLSSSYKHRTCFENILLLNRELELYNPELINKTSILVVNKMDSPDADKKYEDLINIVRNIEDYKDTVQEGMWPDQVIKFDDCMGISAKTGYNIDHLKKKIRTIMDEVTTVEERERIKLMEESGPKLY